MYYYLYMHIIQIKTNIYNYSINIVMGYFYSFLIYCLAQILVWFQIYGPLKIYIIKNNTWVIYFASIPITYLFALGTKHIVKLSNGLTWGSKFIQFGAGVLIFAAMSYMFNNEGLSIKTIISMVLITIVIIIQIV